MAENTKIEWADDTVGFWWGCQENGPECAHCYARDGYSVSIAEVQTGLRLWASNRKRGEPAAVRMKIESAATNLLRLNRKAEKEQRVRLVFINSQADTFEDTDATIVRRLSKKDAEERGWKFEIAYKFEGGVKWGGPTEQIALPLWTLDDERRELFRVADECPWLRLLLLTKRAENIPQMWPAVLVQSQQQADDRNERGELYRRNVWLGVSCGHPDSLPRVEELKKCRDLSPVLFVSAEPMLGPLDFGDYFGTHYQSVDDGDYVTGDVPYNHGIDWVICGGESGPNARPMHPDWPRSLRDQCQAAGVPFLFKQWGEWLPESLKDWTKSQAHDWPDGNCSFRHGYLARKYEPERMRLLDGREWHEFPEVAAD